MSKLRLFFIFLLSSTLAISQAWVKLADFPGSIRDDGVAIVIGDKAFIGSGLDPASETIDFKVFQMNTQQWSSIPNMPLTTERQYACAFGSDTSFYITCGLHQGKSLASTYRYSVSRQVWTSAAAKPGKGVMAATVFQFGEKIILAGGKGDNDSINYQVWEYSLTNNTWQQKNNFPFSPVWRAASATLNGYGYLLGGIDSASRFSKLLYRYNSASEQWVLYDSLPLPFGRAYSAMQGINNRLFIFGGYDSLQNYYNEAIIYEPLTKQWIPAPALPAAGRKGGMSFGDSHHFYYSCGILQNGIRLKETWMTDVPLALQKNSDNQSTAPFPNPASTLITVKWHGDGTNEATIQVFDMTGHLVLQTITRDCVMRIDISDLDAGLYSLSLCSDSENATYRFIKE